MRKLCQLLIIVLLTSCSNNNSTNNDSTNNDSKYFTIHGQTDRVGDVILLKIDPSNNHSDTINIEKGEFGFEKKIEEEELFRLKFLDGSSFDIVANIGEKITIDYQKQDLLHVVS